jgi:hypothetical protein
VWSLLVDVWKHLPGDWYRTVYNQNTVWTISVFLIPIPIYQPNNVHQLSTPPLIESSHTLQIIKHTFCHMFLLHIMLPTSVAHLVQIPCRIHSSYDQELAPKFVRRHQRGELLLTTTYLACIRHLFTCTLAVEKRLTKLAMKKRHEAKFNQLS